MREKVPLRVKGLVIKLSITVEVLCEVGYASRWVGSEGVVKGGAGGIEGEVEREELEGELVSEPDPPPPPPPKVAAKR